MRRLQQRLLVFVLPMLSMSIVQRFGLASSYFIAKKGVDTLLSMSVIDGDLHKNEINDSQQFMASLRDSNMMSMDDFDRFMKIIQSQSQNVSEQKILQWMNDLPVELWRFRQDEQQNVALEKSDSQDLQQRIVFTLSGLSLVSYAALYALVSDQKVHNAELQLLQQILAYFEKPEALLRYVDTEHTFSQSQRNNLPHEIRRYVEEFIDANLLPMTLIQHVLRTDMLRTASEKDSRWATIVDEITEVNTRIIDDIQYFAEAKFSIAHEQKPASQPGEISRQQLSFLSDGDLTVDAISAIAGIIDDDDEQIEAATQLHDMTLDAFGSIPQSDILDEEITITEDDSLPSKPQWRMVLQNLLEAPKITFDMIEASIAEHVHIDQRIEAFQYIMIQLRAHKKRIYEEVIEDRRLASEQSNIETVQMLLQDIQTRMGRSVFASYGRDHERTYLYHELLSAGEERDLCVARDMLKNELSRTNDPFEQAEIRRLDRNVRDVLVNHNYRLVMRIAVTHTVHAHQLELMDLFQEGCIGLIRAVDKFDVSQNTRLSTYATWWIRQSIGRAIDDFDRSIRLPVHFLEAIRHYNRIILTYKQQHYGVVPTHAVIANMLRVSEKVVAKLDFWSKRILSLHAPIDDEEGISLGDYLTDDVDVSQTVEQMDLAENIQRILQDLTDRERIIITRRFGLDGAGIRTLEEIGNDLGVTRERVRQIEYKTLKELRKHQRSLEVYVIG
jgi:RNA polymerase primary sigma factor